MLRRWLRFSRFRGRIGDTTEPLPALIADICKRLDVDALVYGYFPDEQVLRLLHQAGESRADEARVIFGDDALARIMADGEVVRFTHVARAEGLAGDPINGCSSLVVPLRHRGGPVGILVLKSPTRELQPQSLQAAGEGWALLGLAMSEAIARVQAERVEQGAWAVMAVLKAAEGERASDRPFHEALVQLARLTGATRGAVMLRRDDGRYELVAALVDGSERVRQRFSRKLWDPHDWPHLMAALQAPDGFRLERVSHIDQASHERQWADSVGPIDQILGVTIGSETPQGLLLLAWPLAGAMRRQETRLVLAMASVLAIAASARRHEVASLRHLAHAEHARREVADYAQRLVGLWSEGGQLLRAFESGPAALEAERFAQTLRDEGSRLWAHGSDLRDVIDHLARLAEAAYPGLAIEVDVPYGLSMDMRAEAIALMLWPLLDEAARASGDRGRLRLWSTADEDWVAIYLVSAAGAGGPSPRCLEQVSLHVAAAHGRVGRMAGPGGDVTTFLRVPRVAAEMPAGGPLS